METVRDRDAKSASGEPRRCNCDRGPIRGDRNAKRGCAEIAKRRPRGERRKRYQAMAMGGGSAGRMVRPNSSSPRVHCGFNREKEVTSNGGGRSVGVAFAQNAKTAQSIANGFHRTE